MKIKAILLVFIILVLSACSATVISDKTNMLVFPTYDPSADKPGTRAAELTLTPFQTPPTRVPPAEPASSPTPDLPKTLPTIRTQTVKYTVQPNDTLGLISRKYGVNLDLIMAANQITNPNLISVGQNLVIPPPSITAYGTSFKVVPDSELILGPLTAGFKLADFVQSKNGYLFHYTETLDDRIFTGIQVVDRVAREYSVNPRLLLSVLEYQSGWVTHSSPPDSSRDYPLGKVDSYRKGLYRQLAWTADNLNRGYYLWKINAISSWQMADGGVIVAASQINAGTAGVQHFFSLLYEQANWEKAVSDKGLFATYTALFGNPFAYTYEPILPTKLTQPKLQLPFERGVIWSFTGAPHGAWGAGSAWGALDFAPPMDGGGCQTSSEWVVAMADGIIVRSEFGEVVEDLDGDGDERTGWTLLYMHIATKDRVGLEKQIKAGDPIGHPSCEGGVSNGTHTHLARRYNGEWISADGTLPFNLDGWVSEGTGPEYSGFLKKNGQVLEAWDLKTENNQIER